MESVTISCKKESNWEKTKAKYRRKDRADRMKNRRAAEKAGTVKKGDGKQIDHKKPLKQGGSNSKSNLRVVSAKTNLRKEARRKQRGN